MSTSPTEKEIRDNALRFARNDWRRFCAYQKRYIKKYGSMTSTPPPQAYFNNRIREDTFAKEDLPNGKLIETRQKMANSIMVFRSALDDTTEFDRIYAESLARRIAGYSVVVSRAMSASSAVHEKDSIRTFVTKVR